MDLGTEVPVSQGAVSCLILILAHFGVRRGLIRREMLVQVICNVL